LILGKNCINKSGYIVLDALRVGLLNCVKQDAGITGDVTKQEATQAS